MNSSSQSFEVYFSDLLNLAQSTLNLNQEEIKEKFVEYRICVETFIENQHEEKSIKITKQDNSKISLCCYFLDNDKSNLCFLFLKELTDINDYVDFLNNNYDYDFIRSGWILSNCHISIKGNKSKYYFMFSILLD